MRANAAGLSSNGALFVSEFCIGEREAMMVIVTAFTAHAPFHHFIKQCSSGDPLDAKYRSSILRVSISGLACSTFAILASLFTFAYQHVCKASADDTLAPADASVNLLYRLGVLRVIVGVCGLIGSTATLSSSLLVAGGAAACTSLRDLKTAEDVAQGRREACCGARPLRSANLAIAGIIFGLLDVSIAVAVVVILPRWRGFGAECERFVDCDVALSEGFALPL